MTPNRLLVVSHVTHYQSQGRLSAYGPYSREIDIWADLFSEVVIAAPLRHGQPPGDCLPFSRANIAMAPLPETGGTTVGAKLQQLLRLPGLVTTLSTQMFRADAIHIRCPGNVGLLGAVLGPIIGRPRIAKYAGQWNGYDGESWTVTLQRYLLRSWWNAPVTVYGTWPDQPAHVIPFFTSMMTGEQVDRAVGVAEAKVLDTPLRVLFAGRLAPEKRVPALLEALRLVVDRGVAIELSVLGDGPDRLSLEAAVERLGLRSTVRFLGARPFDEALHIYDWAHCLVLPSVHSEGWPKVVAEAMCHGVLCVAVNHGQVPTMLEGRGVLLPTGSAEEIADALVSIATTPARYQPLMLEGSRWARRYSLGSLRSALATLLSERWQTEVRVRDGATRV